MDPKAVAAQQAFMQAMVKLDFDYVMLMYRLGCKRVTVHRI